jgi:hypothetical protein
MDDASRRWVQRLGPGHPRHDEDLTPRRREVYVAVAA